MKSVYKILVIALFSLLFCLSVTSLFSINEDIGRHLKLGEIIWTEKNVPKINLFSYTEQNHPFINHHWLSEVVFYGLYNLGGFNLLIIFKVILQLLSFIILFRVIHKILISKDAIKMLNFFLLIISFVISFFIFSSRNDIRPEIFSTLFFCCFIYILLSAKYLKNYKLLWILPFIEFLWVNFHIYYFLGLFLMVVFVIDSLISGLMSKKVWIILFLTFVFTLINPNFLLGAIYFLNILQNYGFNVSENNSPFVLADLGYFNYIPLYKFSILLLIISYLFIIKKLRNKIFEFAIGIFAIYSSIKMTRNFSIYAVVFSVLIPLNFNDFISKIKITTPKIKWINNFLLISFLLIVIYYNYQLVTNKYYQNQELDITFGLNVPKGALGGTNFIKNNKISGNIFNNFDVGSYLIWQLFPDQKVFIDGRPEAYSFDFIKNIYEPMLLNDDVWQYNLRKYNINYIFFDHRNHIAETEQFINTRAKDNFWKIVYLDDYSIIFVRSNEFKNLKPISEDNIFNNLEVKNIQNSGNIYSLDYLGHLFFALGWNNPAIVVYNKALEINPNSIKSHIGRGFVYAKIVDDKEKQKKALEDLNFAKKIGLKTPQLYLVMGQLYFNLGDFQNARLYWEMAINTDATYDQVAKSLEKLIPDSK